MLKFGSEADREHLRLAAAAAVLKLARQTAYDELISPQQFQILAQCMEVHQSSCTSHCNRMIVLQLESNLLASCIRD